MGIQTMGSQGRGGEQQLARQSSLYTLTLDEVQNQLGDLGKPLSSMNLDELLKNVWTAEANQTMGMDTENAASAGQLASASVLQRQASLTLSRALSQKTVDEVWRDIQQGQNKNNEEKKAQERQPTLGGMTLEDFLVKAGVVAEASTENLNAAPATGVDLMAVPPQSFPQQAQWLQYPLTSVQQQQQQPQHPEKNMMGIYMPAHPVPQSLTVSGSPLLDVAYHDSQIAISPPLMGTLSDTQTLGRKRVAPGDVIEKTVERRQKRMIKNRESAARSRARKQAYTNELENKVSRLEEENERLKKRKELEKMLPSAPPPEPKCQLRRTSSAPF
ncbi:ABSCISIC ACID-INSENSITIVE 5-like protein 2 isoform X2 [Macadamia integrifolia]|uniref:ABSCISIC ACID-INSENSITIVE 5-like protein 2 isoform X2 n=1 Tax=Macadamia integrifolia TaxID=60698 RepID=UPI001C4E4123|nr:ABSCISIC ACID-INSENSITIVE 5-like protein 2 isoform X2 [Macadamia integrifolia]XP_042485632.1 ABSCISIC ACID-INSENSITIVE 5-like protein 2 isoform X2 [Macadamia integrifolia]XP_042485633.1 ABSCISIC ACID-INSENSITIVE 5-like protein 2 isoform X2 [Macadamia integrifolia]XP_042485634.1 ABSCISIC ACID-INSENSITIVE 5-like protein 2 isoform X2 [Macadamia integrifolia]